MHQQIVISIIVSAILWTIASCIEAICDRMFEVFYLPIETQGERLNKNWFSYNPMNPEKGFFGIFRDGWHFLKAIRLGLLALSNTLVIVVFTDWKYFSIFPVIVVIRGIFFNLSLNIVRKKMTSDNNFKN